MSGVAIVKMPSLVCYTSRVGVHPMRPTARLRGPLPPFRRPREGGDPSLTSDAAAAGGELVGLPRLPRKPRLGPGSEAGATAGGKQGNATARRSVNPVARKREGRKGTVHRRAGRSTGRNPALSISSPACGAMAHQFASPARGAASSFPSPACGGGRVGGRFRASGSGGANAAIRNVRRVRRGGRRSPAEARRAARPSPDPSRPAGGGHVRMPPDTLPASSAPA